MWKRVKGLIGVVDTPAPTMVKPTTIAATVVGQILRSSKPHVPMIKFRKSANSGFQQTSASSSNVSTAQPSGSTGQMPIMEEWQLPSRYRRKPIDAEEIAHINRGGPA